MLDPYRGDTNRPMNLPLPDRAGVGELQRKIQRITKDMEKYGHGVNNYEFLRLARELDKCRDRYYRLYGKEAPSA